MTWHLFDVASADEKTRRGFRLIGQLVLRRRQRLGLTQRELEYLSGVDQTVISRLENGRLGGLRWSRFADLVAALGGLAETDALPSWTMRYMPQQGARPGSPRSAPPGPDHRGHQA